MKKFVCAMAVFAGFCFAAFAAEPPSVIVEGVKFRQRYPWNGLVDIDAKIACSDPATNLAVYIAAWDNVKDRALTVKTIWVEGDATKNPDLTVKSGTSRFVWDARADNPGEISDNVSLSVQAYVRDMRYLVIDLSGGANASTYPYSYRADPPEGNIDRLTNLVMRLILPGTYLMGSPVDEVGRVEKVTWNSTVFFAYETLHKVTLTKPFYMGVYEVTQKQYELVSGSNPSTRAASSDSDHIFRCPVENVSYRDIRGSSYGDGWPGHNVVDNGSFIGRMRKKTGLHFDLPTEAQWEYACRAGTTTALNSGRNLTFRTGDENMNMVGRYAYNHNDGKGGYFEYHVHVGQYLPNAWGLYDMHGNVAEWCLDYFSEDLGAGAVVDPVGPSSGNGRVVRGGAYGETFVGNAYACRSAYRNFVANIGTKYESFMHPRSSDHMSHVGFRICCDANLLK